jgi:magnesium transporter
MEGFSSLVSMNLNALVRTLTEITIALAVPAIIAAMWGMNIGLPFEEHEFAFVLLTLLIVAVGVAAFFVIRFAERIRPLPRRRS